MGNRALDRYILWAMERYRQRDDPSDYAHEAKPKKKIRGCVFFVFLTESAVTQVGR